MRLIVATFKREHDSGWVAVVCNENALVSSGACGAGINEFMAINQAVEAFYSRSKPDLKVEPQTVIDSRLDETVPIIEHLRRAVKDGRDVMIKYKKPDCSETVRQVRPMHVSDYEMSANYMQAIDRSDDWVKTFRIDRVLSVGDVA